MRRQKLTNRGEAVSLGYRGENNATLIEFDIPDDWQDGVVQLYVLRMSDQEAYVPSGFYVEDGVAYWQVSSADTSVVGRGLAQFCSIKDGAITKTRVYTTVTEPSASNSDIVVPEPQKSVLDAALESASEFAGQAQTAAGTAQDAVRDVSAGVIRAESAADRAEGAIYEWFTLSVDEASGQLIVTERERDGNNV